MPGIVMSTTVSTVICTHNRAAHLQDTLRSFSSLDVPVGITAELIIVDNASTDETPELIASYRLPQLSLRYLREPRHGKSHALNSAIAAANGVILLFTDDDVRVPKNWIAGMCGPILSGKAHAVQGSIRIAPHLMREWFTPLLQDSLAFYEGPRNGQRVTLIGANMAVSREVFEKVPGFDPEIGPPHAHAEDTLFSWQVEKAGYTIVWERDVEIVHHFDESRLCRRKFVDAAWTGGYNSAYLCHHWLHETHPNPLRSVARAWLRLAYWRIRRWEEWHRKDHVAAWEVGLLHDLSLRWSFLKMRTEPRKYEPHGLTKLPQTWQTAPNGSVPQKTNTDAQTIPSVSVGVSPTKN